MKKRGQFNYKKFLKVFAFFIVLSALTKIAYLQHVKLNQCSNQLTIINKQIDSEKIKRNNYQKQESIINSQSYIEKIARDKLEMVKPGEKIFCQK